MLNISTDDGTLLTEKATLDQIKSLFCHTKLIMIEQECGRLVYEARIITL